MTLLCTGVDEAVSGIADGSTVLAGLAALLAAGQVRKVACSRVDVPLTVEVGEPHVH